ncbi:hypothetical protein GPECTOR_7g1327 [Gonium pectorale]|uniref:DOMON domain-containing protein n=1 Tax=Gonium pectorale TaxID=33097 RepID=A0A150GUB6_GONPE|nr:hypothetical protein GPECTOR_7g1327 [Gonium pectorale]|eukprot:KXZ53429.1 hypothetical protein GPECTOR_7g1327 [Gonium pectorale]
MLAADIAIASRDTQDDNALWSIGDYWSMGFVTPRKDKNHQNAFLLAASQSHAATRVVFWRPLDTCDEEEDRRILRGVINYVVFAYGAAFGYHGPDRRGNAQIDFLPLPTPEQALPAPEAPPTSAAARVTLEAADGGSGASSFLPVVSPGSDPTSASWELRMDSYAVPEDDTTYICRHFEIPNVRTPRGGLNGGRMTACDGTRTGHGASSVKMHVTTWEAIIDNPRYVHHMIIYACSRKPDTPTQLYSCNSMDKACRAFYILWTPGGDKGFSPPEAGVAFGGDSGVNWVSLQVHYTNLELAKGIRDSSGFRLHASSVLRPYDMGVLTLGTIEFVIPPGNGSWSSAPNLCPKECTQRLPHPIKLVSSGFHMHTLGRRIITQWIRNGNELPPLGERKAFAFDYQVGVFVCFNFLSYYPRVPGFEICTSVRRRLDAALCTSVELTERLQDFASPATALALATDMQTKGELIMRPKLDAYATYQPACKPAPVPVFSNVTIRDGSAAAPRFKLAAVEPIPRCVL